ncbi:hypothetical protein ACVENA_06070 [Sphingopyxis sp. 550A]
MQRAEQLTRAAMIEDTIGSSSLAKIARGQIDSPAMRAVLGQFDSATMKIIRGDFDTPTMRMIRGDYDSAATMALKGAFDSASARALMGQFDSESMKAVMGRFDIDTVKATLGFFGSEKMRSIRDVIEHPLASPFASAAELARSMALPDALSKFQPSVASLAIRMSLFNSRHVITDDAALGAFARSAAMSDALSTASFVDREMMHAFRAFSSASMPNIGTLGVYRAFLDASGLWIARWPRMRMLSASEKRQRMRRRLAGNREERHVKKAKSLVHSYELVLRDIIDGAMADAYGDDWQRERLPLCGCNTLIGRAANRGGDPLEHADYAHYRMIMCHDEHFADIFSIAFEDPELLAELVDEAGRLRARSHHPHRDKFKPEDLRDLRLVWRTIEKGMLMLTTDYEFELP